MDIELDSGRGPEVVCPPDFWSEPTERDKITLAAQNRGRRFDVATVSMIAVRCGHGFPQVVVCHPFLRGEPFPTLFWLTCPYLDRKCGELESEQRISSLEEILSARSESVIAWHKEYIALRKSMLDPDKAQKLAAGSQGLLRFISETGVGGINFRDNPHAAKCLHLQAATWLGMRRHPASDWLEKLFSVLWCESARCGKEFEK